MIDAVLFEFDGVLADTGAARRSAVERALAVVNVRLDARRYRERAASLPVRDAVRSLMHGQQALDETDIALVAAHAEREFWRLSEAGLSLAPGARELVEQLHGHARLGIVSRARRREIELALELARLDHAFAFVITDDDAFPAKPSPAPYRGALERLGRRGPVDPAHVVALEDGLAGITSARAAGVRCAVVGDVPAHVALAADALVPTLVGQTLTSLDAVTSGGSRMVDR